MATKKKDDTDDNVRVCCRIRPLNRSELAKPSTSELCVEYPNGNTSNIVCHVKGSSTGVEDHPFCFSDVFQESVTQSEVYQSIGQPAVEDVMKGYNATIFVYGQTGSGKTHSMFGKDAVAQLAATSKKKKKGRKSQRTTEPQEKKVSPPPSAAPDADNAFCRTSPQPPEGFASLPVVRPIDNEESDAEAEDDVSEDSATSDGDTGIIPRVFQEIFDTIAKARSSVEFEVRLMFVEVYMEQARDLLGAVDNKGQLMRLQVREDVATNSFYVEGCAMPYITSPKEALRLIQKGLSRRATSATSMNETSSRSHCLVNVTVKSLDREKQESKMGKLFLVDLAGSEKVAKTKSSGMRLEEAKQINKSLTTLGLVIVSLTEHNAYIPYRDSVLTKILKDSLGGNSKTTLLICCSPSMYNAPETLSTMRFGARAKNIRNVAVINRQLTVAELQNMLNLAKVEIQRLEQQLRGEGPTSRIRREDEVEVDRLLAERAQEKKRTDELQAVVGQLNDELRTASETINALTEQREEQRTTMDSLNEEIQLWEEVYGTLKQRIAARDAELGCAKAIIEGQRQEIALLMQEMEGFLEPLTLARKAAEECMDAGITPQRRRTLKTLEASAVGALFTSRSRSNTYTHEGMHQNTQSEDRPTGVYDGVVALSPSTRRAKEVLEQADRESQSRQDSMATAQQGLEASPGTPRPVRLTAHTLDSSELVHNTSGVSPPPLNVETLQINDAQELPIADSISAAAALRISELESEVSTMQAQFDALRTDYSQATKELQVSERRLYYRQKRIESLMASLQEESQQVLVMRQGYERKLEGQRDQLQKERNTISYWRRQYDEIRRRYEDLQRTAGGRPSLTTLDRNEESMSYDSLGSPKHESFAMHMFRSIVGGKHTDPV